MTASGKPLVVINESHHAGIVIVVGTLALIMTLICLAIRVYVRTILSPGFGRDDYLLFVATVSSNVVSCDTFMKLILTTALWIGFCHNSDLTRHVKLCQRIRDIYKTSFFGSGGERSAGTLSESKQGHKLIRNYGHADNSCYRYFVLDHRLSVQVLCAWHALAVDSPAHSPFYSFRDTGVKYLLGSLFSPDHPCELRIEQTLGKTH